MNPNDPPDGGKMRRQWEAIGMSRASWYRHGKPAEKPEAKITQTGDGPSAERQHSDNPAIRGRKKPGAARTNTQRGSQTSSGGVSRE